MALVVFWQQLRWSLRVWFRRLTRRCQTCGGPLSKTYTNGKGHVFRYSGRWPKICYECAKLRMHARNYGGTIHGV